MPTPEPPGTLPTIEQHLDADYLTARLDAAHARLADRLPVGPGLEQRVRLLPSRQLREVVRQASVIVQDADLTATPLEQLDHQRLQHLAGGRRAVIELASRQRAALRRLETDPPAYLVTVIGRPTLLLRHDDQAALGSWRDLALRVESYRLQYTVTDPTRTLGPRPVGLAQRADRSRIATDIAWSPFGSVPDRSDIGWLHVIGQPDRDPAGALAMLAEATRRHASLPGDASAELEARPSAVLRRRLQEAVGLLRRRRPDRSEQRARLDWDAKHQRALAEGRIAARELRRRELQALQQLATDPPAFLTRELGPPRAIDPARTAWLAGARAIVAYRTTHAIDGPDPLGDAPTDPLARIHRSIAQRHLDHAKQQLQRPGLERSHRALPSQTMVDLPDWFGLPT